MYKIVAVQHSSEWSEATAREMALVGIIPYNPGQDVSTGTIDFIGDQPFVLGEEVSRKQFMERVVEVGLDPVDFEGIAAGTQFFRVSTD